MKIGRNLLKVAVATVSSLVLVTPAAFASDVTPTPVATVNKPKVTIIPATSNDVPKGKIQYGTGVASPSQVAPAASWVCTVFADDVFQDGDWAETTGWQSCSGVGWSPQMLRVQIQRQRWWGWETVKTETDGWTTAYWTELGPAYDCSDDGTYTYRTLTTGWAAGGSYSKQVQSLNYVRFTC